MFKKPFVRALLAVAVLVLAGVAMLAAAGNHGIVTSSDGRHIIATKPSIHVTPAPDIDAGLTTIAGNLSKYPNGVFFCCYGLTISGPDSFLGAAYWDAIPFTPTANYTVKALEASVGWGFNGANGVTLSLNEDSGGLPGKALATANLTNLEGYGSCCKLAIAKAPGGIPVSQGTQYWLVVSTSSGTAATYDGWAFNSTDMRAYPLATYSSTAGFWSLVSDVLPGYAVLGSAQ